MLENEYLKNCPWGHSFLVIKLEAYWVEDLNVIFDTKFPWVYY